MVPRGFAGCLRAVVAGCLLGALGLPALALAERVALVVGNGRYAHLQQLEGPAPDSLAVDQSLRRAGFAVAHVPEASQVGFEAAVDALAQRAQGAEVVLFWYSGHVLQVDGRNRLVPVDARLLDADTLVSETLALDDIVARIGGSGTTLVFLDACRSTLVPAGLRGRGAATQGLAGFDAPAGTFVAFSIRPGALSHDRCEGASSPFARAFADDVARPGQSVSDLLIRIRNAVERATVGRQVPWDQSALRSQVYLGDAGVGNSQEAGDAARDDPGLMALMDDIVTDDALHLGPALVPPGGADVGPVSPVRSPSALRLDPVASATVAARVPGVVVTGQAAGPPTEAALPGDGPAPADLTRRLQAALGRIGCYRLAVDGVWGAGSRNAVRRYLEAKKIAFTVADLDPNPTLWQTLQAETGQVCAAPAAQPATTGKAPQRARSPAPSPQPKGSTAKRKPQCGLVGQAVVCR